MSPSRIIYFVFCLIVLAGLARANLRGYVPFVANAASAERAASTSLFHK
jgi:hypothetical protein